jgi:hypothetical protein
MKNKNLTAKILEYIRRNEREQEIPAGYKSIADWMTVLGCSKRQWGMMLPGLMRSKNAKSVKIRRVKNGKIALMNFYNIDQKFLSDLKKG